MVNTLEGCCALYSDFQCIKKLLVSTCYITMLKFCDHGIRIYAYIYFVYFNKIVSKTNSRFMFVFHTGQSHFIKYENRNTKDLWGKSEKEKTFIEGLVFLFC